MSLVVSDSAAENLSEPTLSQPENETKKPATRACVMDDYQEELLEFKAYELDPVEPAEDATEL